MKEKNLRTFCEKIAEVSWDSVFISNNGNDAYEEFRNILKPIYASSFPLAHIKQNTKTESLG